MERKGFIGGSDAVKIMNGDWLELWQIKTGVKEPDDLSSNLAVQLGSYTEDFNLSWFEKENNCVLSNHQSEFEISSGRIVPLVGTIDAMWNGQIVEAKHTNSFFNMDKMLEIYMPQLQFYMYVADADAAHLSVIFGNSKYECCKVNRDPSYIAAMMDMVNEFCKYVVSHIEPVGIDVPDAPSINKIPVDDMVKRDGSTDNMFMDRVVTYINGYEHNRTFENAKKDLKDMMADNEREIFCDQLSVRRDKRGSVRIYIRNQKEAK